jgi:hypothetical protein
MMDYIQLELDLQIDSEILKEQSQPIATAMILSIESARKRKNARMLSSIYSEIIASVEHIEIGARLYK